jgi:predicted helicase
MKEMLLHKIYQRPLTERIIFLYVIDCDKTLRKCVSNRFSACHLMTISNISLEAWDYVVNRKSTLDWIIKRFQFSIYKQSQMTIHPYDWAD